MSESISWGLSRRGWLGTAVAAGLAGAGVAWWQTRPRPVAEGAIDQLWAMSFDTPAGEAMAMTAFRERKLVVNFWATWCPPCVEELPMLNSFFREQRSKGWSVVGLAVDQPGAVRQFLQKLPLEFPVLMAGLPGIDLSKSLGNASGGLPFTVVIDAAGGVVQRKLGKVSEQDLAQWALLP